MRVFIIGTDLDSSLNTNKVINLPPLMLVPRNPSSNSEWSRKFNKDQIREWVDKLGNLALLSKRRNSQAANYDFDKKKERYFAVRSTPFRITQMLQDYDDWTPETITERHNKLLELAKSIYIESVYIE